MKRRRHMFLAAAAAVCILVTPLWVSAAESAPAPQTGGAPPGAMGAPGGPGGPGGPGERGGPGGGADIGAEARSSEPVVSAAEAQLADFDAVKNKNAVITVFDFGLMGAYPGEGGTQFFRPEDTLTMSELAAAVSGATQLVNGNVPADPVSYCVKKGLLEEVSDPGSPVSGYETADMLLSALGAAGPVKEGLKQSSLTEGLDDVDLSKPISRENAARLIANTLAISDGSGFVPRVLHDSPMRVASGTRIVDNTRIFNLGGSAVENSGESVLVVRNSRIDGDTSVETKPLSGPPGGLLVAGSIRTTLALGQAQAFYINSKVNSKDWAALSTDGAKPATQPGQTELSVYAYGTTTNTLEGGYGTYSDLFCNVSLYGTRMNSAEIGIISGTYGNVTVGTIGDGDACDALAAHLVSGDQKIHPDKSAGSVVTGGRNALMIHSVSLPPYWEYDGYGQSEIPLYSAKLSIHGSTLATELDLGKGIEYPAEKQAYIDHHTGSVILIKSCNTDIRLKKARLIADERGTGAVIHTAINNDTMFSTKVPDGEIYPGVRIRMEDMSVSGDILHEDYQRDMHLSLKGTTLTGKITGKTAEEWNALCREKGFESYLIDPDGYQTVHGVRLALDSGSIWTVAGDSALTSLSIGEGTKIAAPAGRTLRMTVDGVQTSIKAGTFAGNIEIKVE